MGAGSVPHQFFDCRAVAAGEALGTGRLAGHIRGATRDEYTRQGPRAGEAPLHLVDEAAGLPPAVAAINRDESNRRGQRGRRPKGAIRCLITGPARFDGANGQPLSPDEQVAWARGVVRFFRERLPAGGVIASAVMHNDESSPHVHLVLVPYCEETGLIDWRRTQSALAGQSPRLPVITKGMTPEDRKLAKRAERQAASREMERLHDELWRECSAPYGIGRGTPKRKRRAQALDRIRAAELDAASAEAAVSKARNVAREVIADAQREVEGFELAADRALAARDRDVDAAAAARAECERARSELAEAEAAVERARGELAEAEAAVALARDQVREVVDGGRRDLDEAREVARRELAAAREVPAVQLAARARRAEREVEVLAAELARERATSARLRAAIGRVAGRTRARAAAVTRRLVSLGLASYRAEPPRPHHDRLVAECEGAARRSRLVARRRRERSGPVEVPGLEGVGAGPVSPAPSPPDPGPVSPPDPGPVSPAPAPPDPGPVSPAPPAFDRGEVAPSMPAPPAFDPGGEVPRSRLPGVRTAPARRSGSRDRDVGAGV